jgi:hypothetical protein
VRIDPFTVDIVPVGLQRPLRFLVSIRRNDQITLSAPSGC